MANDVQRNKHYIPIRRDQLQDCLNCGTRYVGSFCNNCGQSSGSTNKPFKDFFADILGTIYAFDSRFWYSIRVMFTNPAKLSEDYLNGKRTKLTPPFKLYFFVSFLFFFTINWVTRDSIKDIPELLQTEDSGMVTFSLNEDSTYFNSDSVVPMTDALIDSVYEDLEVGSDSLNEKQTFGFLDFSNARLKSVLNDSSNRKLFMDRVSKFLSWMLIVLMPLFALILSLLYARRKQYYIKHLIFTVNVHTQSFIILSLFFLVNYFVADKGIEFHKMLLLVFPYYLLIGMKKYYKQGWKKTIAKFFILTSLYNFVLLAAFVIVFIIAFGTF